MSIRQNWSNWKLDRLDNREPLMISEFESFMKRLGYSNEQLKFLQSKRFRHEQNELHRSRLKREIKSRYLF